MDLTREMNAVRLHSLRQHRRLRRRNPVVELALLVMLATCLVHDRSSDMVRLGTDYMVLVAACVVQVRRRGMTGLSPDFGLVCIISSSFLSF